MREQNIIDVLEENFIPFAGESLLNNLPSVCDGLLSAHRKVMYAMYKNGVTYDKPHIKLLRASAMAQVYYVFGDMPLNKVMKGMGNNSLNYMYIDPKGNFGDKQKRDGVGSSPRYIECRMSKYAEDMTRGIKQGVVPMKRNFDNTEDEPVVCPSIMPNVLLNTSQSIAVGEASKIPAHNLVEVCDSFISYLNTKDIDKSISLLNGADLSLGGSIIYNKAEFNKIYTTGRGSFTLVGKYEYDNKENCVIITEVPYETYIEVIEEKLRQQYDKGLFREVVDIHDGSDKDGLSLKIYLKKGTNINNFISKLRKYTPFESKMSCNFTMLDTDYKTPMLMSLEDIIVKWTKHRAQCLQRELEYDIQQLQAEQMKLQGLSVILQDLDKAISLIRQSKSEKEAMQNLSSYFALSQPQLDYITTIKMVNMNNEWLTSKINKLTQINKELEVNQQNLLSDTYYKNTIISQLEEVKKKYGQPRRTTIIYEDNAPQVKEDVLVEDFNCTVVVTRQGYLKRNMKYSDAQKTKDDDEVVQVLPSTNKSKLLFFTDKANVYYLNSWDIPVCPPSVLGSYVPSLLSLQDEKIIYTISTTDFNGDVLFAFENGKVAKVTLSSYATKTNRKMVVNGYNTDSALVSINYIQADTDFQARSSIDKMLVINTSNINSKSSKSTMGIQVLKSKDNSVMIEFCPVKTENVEYYRGKPNSIGKFIK